MIRPFLEKGLAEIGMTLVEDRIREFELFSTELKKWNRKINLTSICKDDDIAIKHVIDSLTFVPHVNPGNRVLDIGSGAGIPAIPLAIMGPEVQVLSVDAVGKKILFQRHVSRLLSLKNFEAVHARVESLHVSHAESFDVITSRAFSSLETFVALAAPLLKSGGKIIAMKGPAVECREEGGGTELLQLGFKICSVDTYTLPMNKGERSLVTLMSVNTHE